MRLWIRGECMPVRCNENIEWKYDCKLCMCGETETERHVLQECKNYEKESYMARNVCASDGSCRSNEQSKRIFERW